MRDPIKRIERTAQADSETHEKIRDALVEAGYALLETLFDPEEWPTDVRDRANRMIDRLLMEGSIPNTVQTMDSRSVIRHIVDIKLLAVDIEAARIKGLVRSLSQAVCNRAAETNNSYVPCKP